MKTISFAALVAIAASCSFAEGLPRSTPEAQGVSSAAIQSFIDAANKDIDSLHSLMLVRHGHVVAEGWWAPYAAEAPHSLYSLSKSFTATAVGLAVEAGKLSLDDEVLKFFPGEAPAEPSPQLKSMRVRDLLRMSTGQQTEPPRTADSPWTETFLKHPVPFKPGTHFLYNTSATYMLSAIVQKATGEALLDFLRPRLFEPLGIEHPTWESSPQGINTGGYGLSIRTEDIASFGQLYLQRGKWQGRQLVSEAWVEAAASRQTATGSNPDSDWDQGYGYQFWRSRHGAYRGDGAFGQFCIVLPERDAVIAITSGVRDMQAVLNLVWKQLLPALGDSPLPENKQAQEELRQTLTQLALPTPTVGIAASQPSSKKYVFPTNERQLESLSLTSDDQGGTVLSVRIHGADGQIVCGRGTWNKGRLPWDSEVERAVAGSGAWTADNAYTARLCFYETPFVVTLKLEFSGDELQCEWEPNVGFGPNKPVKLIGKAE